MHKMKIWRCFGHLDRPKVALWRNAPRLPRNAFWIFIAPFKINLKSPWRISLHISVASLQINLV